MVSQHFGNFFMKLNKFVSMHHKNFQTLATEMFETQRLLPAKILEKYLFPKQVTIIFIETIFLKAPSNSNSKFYFHIIHFDSVTVRWFPASYDMMVTKCVS